MKTIKRIIKRIKFYLTIRDELLRAIRRTTSEREHFKNSLKWEQSDPVNEAEENYLKSRIEMKNEVLYQLRNLL